IRSRLALILLLSLAGLGWHPRADAGGPGPPAGWTAIPPERLAELRGGYVLGGGLVVSFGFERLAWVNGELVASLRVDVPDVARISAEQARELARLQALQRVQVGSGNHFDEVTGRRQAMNFAAALGQAGHAAAGGGPGRWDADTGRASPCWPPRSACRCRRGRRRAPEACRRARTRPRGSAHWKPAWMRRRAR